jgi:hypothetical protein
MKTIKNLKSEYLPADQLRDKTWYKTVDGSNLWYYWLDRLPNLKDEPNDLDEALRSLVHFLITNNYKTLPSCEGHVLSAEEAKLTLEKLLEDERRIRGDGLELINTEDDEDVVLFKNPDYNVPFKDPSEIIQEKYSGYVGIEIPDEDLLKSIYNELASVDEDVQVDIDEDRLDIYVETDSQKRQKELWKEITEIVKTEISNDIDKKEARLSRVEYFYKIAKDPRVGTGKKPKGSSRRLYTDENPKDTVPVKFRTVSDIRETLSRSDFKSKSHKRQSQIINLIHQRVRAAYQNAKDAKAKARLKKALQYAESKKEQSKEKTKRLQRKASINYLYKTAAHPQTRNMDNKKLPPFFRKNLDYGERETFIKKRLEDSAKDYNAPRTGKGKKRWSVKYKKKINCSNPKGFSQKQYCKRKRGGGKYRVTKNNH